MSKAVLISIRPKWCGLIANGGKTVEVRKTRPKLEAPFKVYIYKTLNGYKTLDGYGVLNKGYGEVIGEFVCDKIYTCVCNKIQKDLYIDAVKETERQTQLSWEELCKYQAKKPFLYGWHISALQIYDEPKEIGSFIRPNNYCSSKECWGCGACALERPPMSWCYAEEL